MNEQDSWVLPYKIRKVEAREDFIKDWMNFEIGLHTLAKKWKVEPATMRAWSHLLKLPHRASYGVAKK